MTVGWMGHVVFKIITSINDYHVVKVHHFTSRKVEALFLNVVAPKLSGKITSGMQVEMVENQCIYLFPRSGFFFFLIICWYGKDI